MISQFKKNVKLGTDSDWDSYFQAINVFHKQVACRMSGQDRVGLTSSKPINC